MSNTNEEKASETKWSRPTTHEVVALWEKRGAFYTGPIRATVEFTGTSDDFICHIRDTGWVKRKKQLGGWDVLARRIGDGDVDGYYWSPLGAFP